MTPEPERTSQLLRGVLDVCLLAVLVDEPAYGYEMTRRLAARGLDVVGEGSIYPVLGRLERGGLVEPFQQPSDGGPPRKYYRVTPQGRSALERWSKEWNQTRSSIDAVLSLKEVKR
ncbi:MAG: PadR family transcriptional regulator [Gaiellaceae bacterium]